MQNTLNSFIKTELIFYIFFTLFFRNCKPCPIVKPMFLCGNDNKTYSSLCRLDYHNCIHTTSIRIACKGFCPCKGKLLVGKQQKVSVVNTTQSSVDVKCWKILLCQFLFTSSIHLFITHAGKIISLPYPSSFDGCYRNEDVEIFLN